MDTKMLAGLIISVACDSAHPSVREFGAEIVYALEREGYLVEVGLYDDYDVLLSDAPYGRAYWFVEDSE